MLFALIWAMTLSITVHAKEKIRIGLMVFDEVQSKAFADLSRAFARVYPDTEIVWKYYEENEYKKGMDFWLSQQSPVDVLYWQGGERLRHYAKKGYLEALDHLWQEQGFDLSVSSNTRSVVSWQGSIYAIPYSYYHWGIYYRKSLFAKYHLAPPANWEDLLSLCSTLRQKNIAPFTIGTKNRWPATAWFDYLNLRINGLAFHLALTRGEQSFVDKRVEAVFEHWQTLLNHQCFIDNRVHDQWDWSDSLTPLYRKKAAMVLMGNFFVSTLTPSMAQDIGFFRFPVIDPAVPRYEEAPTDVFILPRNSPNKEMAKRFLAFIGQASVQSDLNQRVGKLSTHLKAESGNNDLLNEGLTLLGSAAGITQFFDRDAPKMLGDEANRLFAEFMTHRNTRRTLTELESARVHYINSQVKKGSLIGM